MPLDRVVGQPSRRARQPEAGPHRLAARPRPDAPLGGELGHDVQPAAGALGGIGEPRHGLPGAAVGHLDPEIVRIAAQQQVQRRRAVAQGVGRQLAHREQHPESDVLAHPPLAQRTGGDLASVAERAGVGGDVVMHGRAVARTGPAGTAGSRRRRPDLRASAGVPDGSAARRGRRSSGGPRRRAGRCRCRGRTRGARPGRRCRARASRRATDRPSRRCRRAPPRRAAGHPRTSRRARAVGVGDQRRQVAGVGVGQRAVPRRRTPRRRR